MRRWTLRYSTPLAIVAASLAGAGMLHAATAAAAHDWGAHDTG